MKPIRIESENAVLEVKIYNPDKHKTIIILNGGPGIPDYLEDVAIFLSNGFRVITFDQRGAGQSIVRNNSYLVDEYLDDINAIAVALNIAEFHIFGHSWGGLLAQLYAIKFHDKVVSMFLCNSFPGVGHQWVLMEKDIVQFTRLSVDTNIWLKILCTYLMARKGLIKTDSAMRRIIAIIWDIYAKDHGLAKQNNVLRIRDINAKAIFKTREKIINTSVSTLENTNSLNSIPTFILFGSNDIFLKTKWITRSRYPLAQYLELEGGGHFPWKEKEDNFKRVLRQFYNMTEVKLL